MHLLSPRLRRRTVAAGAATALVGGLLVATIGTADAAAPSSGTLSESSQSLSYGGGPFLVSNVSATAGPADCSAPTSCDDYALTVDPTAAAPGRSLRINVQWANTVADFDVYLLDKDGREVAAAASSSDPEVIITAPVAGLYTVRVVPFTVAGDSYTATLSLTTDAPPPPVSSAPATGFDNFPAPATLPRVHDAGEPSIGYDGKTDASMYQAYTATYRTTYDDTTSPATATFTDVSANLAKGCPGGSTTSLDPILATEPLTGRTIESQLLDVRAAGSLSCVTSDAGKTWTTSQGGGLNSAVDHQTLGWGPYAPTGVAALRTYPSAELYYCSQDIADASCSTSSDGGITFGPAVPMYTLQQCGGLHGHVKVGPDGTAYVPNKSCGGMPAVVVSEDNGLTWAIRPVPGGSPGESDPSVAIAKDGTVYLGWNGADNHAFTAVSHDKGKTWSSPVDVGAQLGIQNTVFPAAVAGDGDRAAVAFIGTTTAGNSSETDVFKGVWQLYVASTFDGGTSWKTSDVTGADPVQRGSICTGGTTCGNDRNLLDFMDATLDPAGRVLVGYADGCTAACATTTAPTATTTGYRDAYATIARQSTGLRMFAANDPVVAPTPVVDLTVRDLQTRMDEKGRVFVSALAVNSGNQPLSGITVAFFDGRKSAFGTSSPIALAGGETQRVEVLYKAAGSGRQVVAVIDPQNTIAEQNEGNNKTASSPAS